MSKMKGSSAIVVLLALLHLTYSAPSTSSSNNCTSVLAAIEGLGVPAKGELIH